MGLQLIKTIDEAVSKYADDVLLTINFSLLYLFWQTGSFLQANDIKLNRQDYEFLHGEFGNFFSNENIKTFTALATKLPDFSKFKNDILYFYMALFQTNTDQKFKLNFKKDLDERAGLHKIKALFSELYFSDLLFLMYGEHHVAKAKKLEKSLFSPGADKLLYATIKQSVKLLNKAVISKLNKCFWHTGGIINGYCNLHQKITGDIIHEISASLQKKFGAYFNADHLATMAEFNNKITDHSIASAICAAGSWKFLSRKLRTHSTGFFKSFYIMDIEEETMSGRNATYKTELITVHTAGLTSKNYYNIIYGCKCDFSFGSNCISDRFSIPIFRIILFLFMYIFTKINIGYG